MRLNPLELENQLWGVDKLRNIFTENDDLYLVSTGSKPFDNFESKDKGLIVFWFAHEGNHSFDLPKMDYVLNIHKLAKDKNIDEKRIVFINADLSLEKSYDIWFDKNKQKYNLTNKINCLGFAWYFLHDKYNIIKKFGVNPFPYQNNKSSKKFLSLNGLSNDVRRFVIKTLTPYQEEGYLSDLSQGKSLDKLPDTEFSMDSRSNHQFDFLLTQYHRDSLFSVVCESASAWDNKSWEVDGWDIEDSNQNYIEGFFTEKITKPLYYGHPFILIGSKNSYKHLKNMGYDVYDDIFDLSFDSLETWEERTKAVCKQVQELLDRDITDLQKIFDCGERIIENQNNFFNNEKFLDNFIEQIDDIQKKTMG